MKSDYVDYLESMNATIRRSWDATASELAHIKKEREEFERELARVRDTIMRELYGEVLQDHPSMDDPTKIVDLIKEYRDGIPLVPRALP